MSDVREQVAETARRVVAAGLIEAFGHVSARLDDGFAVTSTRPLAATTEDDVIVVDGQGVASDGPVEALPLETPMHAALYRARPDVAAVCRGHPGSVVAWGTSARPLPLLHGLGALAGTGVRVHPSVELVTTPALGDAVASTLGVDQCVILQANGALAVGAGLDEAATRLWFLEERARIALAAPSASVHEVDWARRLEHTDAELRRAIAWFTSTFGKDT